MLAPVTHVLPFTTIQRERSLPVPGRVLVRQGQRVDPSDAVAEATLTPEHLVLDIAKGLALPRDRADEQIQRKAGEQVSEGDVLAGPVGITRRVVRAPRAGRVLIAGNGQMLLQVESRPFQLRAGIPGIVVGLILERGVVIENKGALVQGVWGNGRIDYGSLHVLASRPDHALSPDQLDASLRGAVVFAGYCDQAEVLKTAAEAPLKGLILSSMASALIPVAARMPYPIVLIEGFGLLPMNSAAFNLLVSNDRREVALNAEPWDRFTNRRPEVFVPLAGESRPAEESPPTPLDKGGEEPRGRLGKRGGESPPTPLDKGGAESHRATLSVAAHFGKRGEESPPAPFGKRGEESPPAPLDKGGAEPRGRLGKGGEEIVEFAVDQRVRVVRAPHKSQIGTIANLLPGTQVFPSGVQGQAAEVRLEDGNKAILPLANLEVLV